MRGGKASTPVGQFQGVHQHNKVSTLALKSLPQYVQTHIPFQVYVRMIDLQKKCCILIQSHMGVTGEGREGI